MPCYTIDKAIAALNAAVKADPTAITALIQNRVPCNRKLADHQTIQVGVKTSGEFEVGALGLINGVLEAITLDRVAAMITDAGEVVGFCKYENSKK